MNKQNKIPQMFATFNYFQDCMLISTFQRFAERSTKREPITSNFTSLKKAPRFLPSQLHVHKDLWAKTMSLGFSGQTSFAVIACILADFISCIPIKKPRDIVGFLSLGAARKNA